jgi:hypothetical protein
MAKMKPQQDTTPDLTDGGEQRTKQKRISMTRKSKKFLHKNEQYSHTTTGHHPLLFNWKKSNSSHANPNLRNVYEI